MRIDSAEFQLSAFSRSQFPRDRFPEVAFVGRSNVGKSSLMNQLLGKKGLARTSSTPGRTRSVNYFLINRRFYFVDLPGYGYAKAGKEDRKSWAKLVDQYFQHADERVRVIQLIDGKVGATPLDVEAMEYSASYGVTSSVVATKIDRVPRGKRSKAISEIRSRLELPETSKVIQVSAKSGEGIKELWKEIDGHLDASGK